MQIEFSGKSFPHEAGAFCLKRKMSSHFIGFFLTDYVYEKNEILLRGNKGDMLIIPAREYVYHGPTPDMTEGFVNDWAYIKGDAFIEEAIALSLPIGVPFSVGGERHLAAMIEKTERERAYQEEGYEKMISCHISEMLIKLARAYKRGSEGDAATRITALRGELAAEPKRAWTLAMMAGQCGYSESRFSALYKSTYGVSPMADLLNIRLENARFLLLYSTKPITEIALESGFSSVFYFSSFFKRHFGTSPKEFRERGGAG